MIYPLDLNQVTERMQRKGTKLMKGKGYRSNVAKAVWIVIVHLRRVAAVICAAFFVMIYQTGIRLDDRGKSYIQSEGFRERLNSRGTDILESLSAKEDIIIFKRRFIGSDRSGRV